MSDSSDSSGSDSSAWIAYATLDQGDDSTLKAGDECGWVFYIVFFLVIAAIFLSACTTDDPERMRVQAEGEKATVDQIHLRPAKLDRSQPAASAPG